MIERRRLDPVRIEDPTIDPSLVNELNPSIPTLATQALQHAVAACKFSRRGDRVPNAVGQGHFEAPVTILRRPSVAVTVS